jgi:hypothetical protein
MVGAAKIGPWLVAICVSGIASVGALNSAPADAQESYPDYKHRDGPIHSDEGGGGFLWLGAGILGDTVIQQATRPGQPKPDKKDITILRCYPDFNNTPGTVFCASRAPSTGYACTAPNSCYLYVNKSPLIPPGRGPVTVPVGAKRSSYSCACE